MNFYPSGTQLGNYEIVIGPGERPSLMGGMGIVYLGFDTRDGRPVALKTFQPQFLPDRNARERFLREGQAWVQLERHPHIVHCLGVERFRHDQVYLVLEQIAPDPAHGGASLRDWLPPGSNGLPLPTALLFALQVVRGMVYATEQLPGFVHRDLKPGNILVGADHLPEYEVNRVRITDFGLATTIQDIVTSGVQDTSQDSTDEPRVRRRTILNYEIVGTPLYMAPEQWHGEPPTTATDIYALGLILQEMISGHPAILGHGLTELQDAHTQGKRHSLPIHLPPAVADFIAHCSVPVAKQRYQTWAEVETKLALLYMHINGQSVPPSAPTVAQTQQEQLALGWGLNSLGMSYQDLGQLGKALALFEQVVTLGENLANPALQAAGLGNLGNTYIRLGDARRAIGYYEQNLTLVREIGDRSDEGQTLGNLGEAYRLLGNAHQAVGYYEQYLTIAREIGDRAGEGTALSGMGIACDNLGEIRRALSYHEQHLTITRETGNQISEGTALANLGTIYGQLGDVHRAIGYHEQHLTIARETSDRIGEGIALGNLGGAYGQLGNTHRAIDYLEQALIIARETGDRIGEGTTLGNLGVAYRERGDIHRAINYLKQQLIIVREIGAQVDEGKALFRLGIAYEHLGDTHRAIDYLKQSLALVRQTGDRFGEGKTLGNLGSAYLQVGDTRRAISYQELRITIARETNDRTGEAMGRFNLALAYAQEGRLVKAVASAEKAARFFQQMGYTADAQRAAQLLARLQEDLSGSHNDPILAQFLANFQPLIEAAIAAAQGNQQARQAVEANFENLTSHGWQIADPIQRIWAGERDAATLTAGIDPNSALIIRAILEPLQE